MSPTSVISLTFEVKVQRSLVRPPRLALQNLPQCTASHSKAGVTSRFIQSEALEMTDCNRDFPRSWSAAVNPEGQAPIFAAGDLVTISKRSPIGHFRVPNYIRGKRATVEAVIEPAALNNEEEGFGRNAGNKRHYYRLAIPLTELWPDYSGSPIDGLRIEVFESWLEGEAKSATT